MCFFVVVKYSLVPLLLPDLFPEYGNFLLLFFLCCYVKLFIETRHHRNTREECAACVAESFTQTKREMVDLCERSRGDKRYNEECACFWVLQENFSRRVRSYKYNLIGLYRRCASARASFYFKYLILLFLLFLSVGCCTSLVLYNIVCGVACAC